MRPDRIAAVLIGAFAVRRSAVEDVPEHLRRYPTKAGREALAARLELSIDPFSQDWEWEVADVKFFTAWLALYNEAALTDDERFSLMEMLVQCVDDMCPAYTPPEQVEHYPEWQAVAALLRARPHLHASTITYWSKFGGEWPEGQFAVSSPMRRVWADVEKALAHPAGGSGM